jgi:hypothetical protein
MTTTIDAMETVIRLERALTSGRQLAPETVAAAQTELETARAEIKPLSEAMDWAFQQVAQARANRRRLEGAISKAQRALKKAEEDATATAAAAAKKFVGARAALEAKKVSPAVTVAKKEIADAELALTDLEKESRFVARLVEEECLFLDGMDTIREWTARGRMGAPPACAVAWTEATRQNTEALYPLTALPAWAPVNEERTYADVADSTDEDVLLWSLPEPEKPVEPVANPITVPIRFKKPVIPADETPAQRKHRMLFRKVR